MTGKFHISLDVNHIQESVAFYTALFNAQPTKVKPGYAKFDLDNPSVNLTLQEGNHCCIQGLSHLGVRVNSAEEIQAARQRLNAAGLNTEDETNTTCCYALQDKIWVKDPTGYRWEVYVFKGDAEKFYAPAATAESAQTTACCGGM